MGASQVTSVTWFITMSRVRRIVVPSQTMQSFFLASCGYATNILTDRHKVTVSIFLVHCLSDKIRVIIETLQVSLPNHLKLIVQWFCEHLFCRTTVKQNSLNMIVILGWDVWANRC